MKKFKFFKVLYYSLMVLVGLIMCVILPNYNEYTFITNEMEEVLESKRYSELPGYFYSKYYNEKPIYSGKTEDNKHDVYVFETLQYNDYDISNGLKYTRKTYMGFIFGVTDFEYQSTEDSETGKIKNDTKLVYYQDDKTETIKHGTDRIIVTDQKQLDFLYFDLTEYDLSSSKLDAVNSLKLYNNQGNVYASIKFDKQLDFNSEFFNTYGSDFTRICNANQTDVEMYLNGNFTFTTKDAQGNDLAKPYTTISEGSTIVVNPHGKSTIVIKSKGGMNVTGNVTKDSKDANKYEFVGSDAVKITTTGEVELYSISITYGEMTVNYYFDGTLHETNSFTGELDGKTTLGRKLDSEAQKAEFEEWKKAFASAEETEDTKCMESNAGSTFSPTKITVKTIIQIVVYFLVMIIIGDFLVGKHYIIYFFQKRFGKKKVEEVQTEINNEYLVNVEIKALVPVGYNEDVHVKYVKDEENIIDVVLKKSTEYKHVERFKNGTYKLECIEALNAHAIRGQNEILVRGFKYKLDIALALDETETKVEETQE